MYIFQSSSLSFFLTFSRMNMHIILKIVSFVSRLVAIIFLMSGKCRVEFYLCCLEREPTMSAKLHTPAISRNLIANVFSKRFRPSFLEVYHLSSFFSCLTKVLKSNMFSCLAPIFLLLSSILIAGSNCRIPCHFGPPHLHVTWGFQERGLTQ